MNEEQRNDPAQPDVEETSGASAGDAGTQPLGEAAAAEASNGAITAEEFEALQRERDEYLDQWRRTAAEFQNFKKREERMRAERERAANSRLLTRLLPVLDDLKRAAQYVPSEHEDHDWVKGVLAIERKLWNVLEQEGVSPIEAAPGTEFDPSIHEALLSVEDESVASGQIVNELESGYRLKETVLRPARVSVAR